MRFIKFHCLQTLLLRNFLLYSWILRRWLGRCSLGNSQFPGLIDVQEPGRVLKFIYIYELPDSYSADWAFAFTASTLWNISRAGYQIFKIKSRMQKTAPNILFSYVLMVLKILISHVTCYERVSKSNITGCFALVAHFQLKKAQWFILYPP